MSGTIKRSRYSLGATVCSYHCSLPVSSNADRIQIYRAGGVFVEGYLSQGKGTDTDCIKSRGYQGSNRTLKARGTTADYLTARIARKHKDILERMKAGEFSITPTCAGASTKAGQAGWKFIIPLLIPRKVKETFLPACPVTTTDSILLKASRVPRK